MASERRQVPAPYGSTAAPPPTPSTQPISSSSAMDTLSLLLHRLPPSLALRPSRSPRATTPPIISLTSPTNLLHSASQLGFFQLTDHSISAQLARSADSEAASLFNLSHDQKTLRFPQNWPLGFENDDDETQTLGSFCINLAESTELGSVRKLACEMERVGLEVIEALSCAVGFVNPVRVDPAAVCSLLWISQGSTRDEPVVSGKLYPYVVALEYQIKRRKCSLLTDSGWVSVSPHIDSLLVTIGDIGQVWSNGKLKKVRGRGLPCLEDDSDVIISTITLVVTLPLNSTVSPLPPAMVAATNTASKEEEGDSNGDDDVDDDGSSGLKYKSFCFEDYAWRVYHERLHLKDPLHRYLT